jgi:hypothetical protein
MVDETELASQKKVSQAQKILLKIRLFGALALPILFCIGMFYFGQTAQPVENQPKKVLTVEESRQQSKDIIYYLLYRNLRGYENFCKEADFELTKYPVSFRRTFHEELAYLEKSFAKQGLSVEGVLDELEKQIAPFTGNFILEDMKLFKKVLIKQEVEVPKNKTLSTDSSNGLSKDDKISMRQVCSALDDFAETYFERNTELKSAFQKNILAF